jgi:C4-dicarboxylate transporter
VVEYAALSISSLSGLFVIVAVTLFFALISLAVEIYTGADICAP